MPQIVKKFVKSMKNFKIFCKILIEKINLLPKMFAQGAGSRLSIYTILLVITMPLVSIILYLGWKFKILKKLYKATKKIGSKFAQMLFNIDWRVRMLLVTILLFCIFVAHANRNPLLRQYLNRGRWGQYLVWDQYRNPEQFPMYCAREIDNKLQSYENMHAAFKVYLSAMQESRELVEILRGDPLNKLARFKEVISGLDLSKLEAVNNSIFEQTRNINSFVKELRRNMEDSVIWYNIDSLEGLTNYLKSLTLSETEILKVIAHSLVIDADNEFAGAGIYVSEIPPARLSKIYGYCVEYVLKSWDTLGAATILLKIQRGYLSATQNILGGYNEACLRINNPLIVFMLIITESSFLAYLQSSIVYAGLYHIFPLIALHNHCAH